MTTTTGLIEPTLPQEGGAVPPPRRRGMSIGRLYPVLRLVEATLARRLRVADMAATAGLTMFHFSREFMRLTGVSPYAYVRQRRIARAALLLAGSRLTIQEIAREVGFGSHSHFTTVFARHTGITPARYRKRYGPLAAKAAAASPRRSAPAPRRSPAPRQGVPGD